MSSNIPSMTNTPDDEMEIDFDRVKKAMERKKNILKMPQVRETYSRSIDTDTALSSSKFSRKAIKK